MITIGFCTREHNQAFIDHLKVTCAVGEKNIEIIEVINTGDKSLTECYNNILNESTNKYVVFLHDDITFESCSWGGKLIKLFENNPDFGIIGVAGTKYLSENGKWWSDPKKMYGRVKHNLNGKTYLSAYSDDLNNIIEEVVVVDGVLFAIDKNKIKSNFDNAISGFHFYDIDFCFNNFIQGVKVGVTTKIKIIHKSGGKINDQWEANSQYFSNKFKNKLPVTIKRVLRKSEKLKVLIACNSFKEFTGSELYVYELAKGLVKEGCEVSICSNLGDPLLKMAVKLGIKVYPLTEPPSFKLGDGKWQLKGFNGAMEESKPNTLYKVNNTSFDIIHLNHNTVSKHLLKLFPDGNFVAGIHSEIIKEEEPVISPLIKKYIAIRPEIAEQLTSKFAIEPDRIQVIYNPVDSNRFKVSKHTQKNNKKRVLFVGTIDYLREQAIRDLVDQTKNEGSELWVVGIKRQDYINDILKAESHVKYFEPTYAIEKYVNQCDEVAGILLGRTTIEGWMCGKPALIYEVDSSGAILSKGLHEVPEDINKFSADNVVKEVVKLYKEII